MGDNGLSLGKKLLISCKIGDYDDVHILLDEIESLEPAGKEAALDAVDKKGNNHLHLIIAAPEAFDEFEAMLDDKKECVFRLLDLDVDYLLKNEDGDDVEDLCPPEFRHLSSWLMGKQSKKSRGGSIVSEAMTVKSVTSAAKTLIAAARFKGLISGRTNSAASDTPSSMAATSS